MYIQDLGTISYRCILHIFLLSLRYLIIYRDKYKIIYRDQFFRSEMYVPLTLKPWILGSIIGYVSIKKS